ncbi:MAG: hypothetical protein OQJ89_09830 [Kangiellaceae bacterium]|nr:hypothetical protein [Kangiellaceae bacterium]
MPVYYVNKNIKLIGEHEVHTGLCPYFPIEINRHLLGDFRSCEQALNVAGEIYSLVNGCYWCCRDCHRSKNIPKKETYNLENSS